MSWEYFNQPTDHQSVWLIVVDIPSKSNATETNPNFVALATWPHNTCINPSWWAAAVAASSVALCWVDADHLSSTSCPSTGLCGVLCGAVGICVDLCGAPMYRFSTGTMSVMDGQCMPGEDNVYQGVERWSGFKSASALTTINNSLAPSLHNRFTMPPFTINYLLLLILVVTRIIDKHMPISARSWSCHCQRNIWKRYNRNMLGRSKNCL